MSGTTGDLRVLVEQEADRDAISRLMAATTTIYVSGPRGRDCPDCPEFGEAASWLRSLGFEVRSACEIALAFREPDGTVDRSVVAAAQVDALLDSGLVVLVGDWQSGDAQVETDLALAQAAGIPWIAYADRHA